jgi:hypothetical protein
MANIYQQSYLDVNEMGSHEFFKTKNKLFFLNNNNKIDYQINVDIPFYPLIEKNYDYLKLQSKYILLEPKYKYRPDYLSFDEYGIIHFWFILLYLNDCYDIYTFDKRYVYIPTYEDIIDLLDETNKQKIESIIYNKGDEL